MKKTMSKLSGTVFGIVLCVAAFSNTGCQTTVGGQTLPSPYYLTDDIQYFPKGPEFRLTNTVRAMEEYKLEQEKIESGLVE